MTTSPRRLSHALYLANGAARTSLPQRQSRLIPGLRVFLWNAQGHVCGDCKSPISDPMARGVELAHVHGECGKDRGYGVGNVFLACRDCNEEHIAYGASIPWEEIQRLDIIIMGEWPTASDLIAGASEFVAARESARVARAARRNY